MFKMIVRKNVTLLSCVGILFVLINCVLVNANPKRDSNLSNLTNDHLLLTRCESKCHKKSTELCSVPNCVKNSGSLFKSGSCPASPTNALDAFCRDTCDGEDYQCPGTEKCCRHACGRTCQEPIDLRTNGVAVQGLPPIPEKVKISSERRRAVRTAELSWEMALASNYTHPIYYVVEGRAHIGTTFAEHKLSDWQLFIVQQTYDLKIRHFDTDVRQTGGHVKLRPGRWYQFRIAAVNENGTRGYSQHSKEFQLKERPKSPRPPRNVTIEKLRMLVNSTYCTRVHWSSPIRSDLPIERYKISWSLHLKDVINSLSMEHVTVAEPIRSYELWNLLPNSVYYVQVQAISVYGQKRLRSNKESILLNTREPDNVLSAENRNLDSAINANITKYDSSHVSTPTGFNTKSKQKYAVNSREPNMAIRFISNRRLGLIVRTLWSDIVAGDSNFVVEICQGTPDCFDRAGSSEFHSVRTKKNQFDFINLRFGTQYTARLKKVSTAKDVTRPFVKSFFTPSCTAFKKRHFRFELMC